MFIHLDDSLVVDDAATALEIKRAVRNLTNAAFESKHILYGDLRVIAVMREKFKSEMDLFRVLDRIYQKYSTIVCPPEITYYIRVTIEDGPVETDEKGRCYANVSYKQFMDSESTQACNLVSEDFNDCEFYRIVLGWYKKINNYKISCRFNDCSGSGERTPKYLREVVYRKKQITLCFVDSDRKYMGQLIPLNTTCSKCASIGKNIATYHFEILDVQEIENLVPFNVVDNFLWTAESIDNKTSFDHLRNNAKSEMILPFFDIKKGLKKDALFLTDYKYRDYVKTCYYLNPELSAHGNFDVYVNKLAEEEIIYKHLRKGLLRNFLDYIKEHPNCDLDLMGFQMNAWNLIGQLMLNMGCCRNMEAIS